MTQEENNSLFMTYELEGGIKICLYENSKDNASPLERIHIEKESNGKTKRKQIINVYCDKCQEICQNDLLDDYDEFDQKTIKMGALMVCNNIFEVCDMVRKFEFSEEYQQELVEAYINICIEKKSKISITIN